ncbi:MAG: AraC family transcriptional regulator [Clostridia bacterium]|nr:AraC family transcriptional regulator [Clostridia bacterium]
MKVSELIKTLNLTVATEPNFEDRDVTGCYIGDLLSWVMGKAQSGDAWITIMNNINIVAVASLTDSACIILCEGVSADEAVINKANSEGIIILKSGETAYSLACQLSGEI